jgi:hypothetical protein
VPISGSIHIRPRLYDLLRHTLSGRQQSFELWRDDLKTIHWLTATTRSGDRSMEKTLSGLLEMPAAEELADCWGALHASSRTNTPSTSNNRSRDSRDIPMDSKLHLQYEAPSLFAIAVDYDADMKSPEPTSLLRLRASTTSSACRPAAAPRLNPLSQSLLPRRDDSSQATGHGIRTSWENTDGRSRSREADCGFRPTNCCYCWSARYSRQEPLWQLCARTGFQ